MNKPERDLDNSRPLSVHKWSNFPEANMFVNQVWENHLLKHITKQDGSKQKLPTKKQFKKVLLDLYVCWLEDPNQSLGIPLWENAYRAWRFKQIHMSGKKTPLVVRTLKEEGLVDWHKGSEKSGRVTRVWPTNKLITLFNRSDLAPHMIEHHHWERCVALNDKEPDDKKAKSIVFNDDDHPKITEWELNLQDYNKLLESTYIDVGNLDHPVVIREKTVKGNEEKYTVRVDQNHKFVRRVFYRGSWELGGRMHGGFWQNLSKEMRGNILMDDMPTVEVDFSGMHISIIYALEGSTPPQDPYRLSEVLLEGYTADQQRKVVKGLVLMAINAKGSNKAFSAYRDDQKTGSREKGLTNAQLKQLLDQFIEENQTTEKYLCSDKGVELMHYDGEIAYRVICNFTNRNLPLLCVHDSFIVKHTHDNDLYNTMIKEAKEVVGQRFSLDANRYGLGTTLAVNQMERMNTYDNTKRLEGLRHSHNNLTRCINYQERYNQWLELRKPQESEN